MRRNAVLCVAGLAVLMAVGMAKANLIQNGGFETGELSPWEVLLGEVSVESADFMSGLFSPWEGNYMAVLSPDTVNSSALVQANIGTGNDPLRLSFYYNLIAFNEGNTPASDYAELYFNGDVIASATLTDSLGGSYSQTGWQLFSGLVTPPPSGQSWLGFALWNDEQCDASSPEQRAMVLLDDVRLTAVPDGGSTGPLLVLAAVALCAGGRRRLRHA